MMEYIGGHDLWELLHDIQLTGHLNSISGKNGGNYSNGTLNNNNIGGSDIIDIHNNIGAVNSSGADDAVRAQVGCHWSLAQFYFAEAIDAVEYMHRYIIIVIVVRICYRCSYKHLFFFTVRV